MKKIDLVIIGGGPAGMAAAVSAYNNGIKNILILEREDSLGGILQQCIHNGFGLHKFKEEFTGPEYAWKYEKQVLDLNIPYQLNTMVIDISADKAVTFTGEHGGSQTVQAKAVILAMGCRERSRGALNIAGTRPAGIFTAGTAQRFVNIMGYMPGKRIVILGSGDIGLIMARRMTLEGAKVEAVCELLPYSSGLTRNIVQCLNDFDIPLKLSHTVVKIHGKERVTGVTIAKVDQNRKPIAETEEYIACDTLLLSVGLIPENELAKSAGIELDLVTGGAVVNQNRETSQIGIFACGNVLHVHDLVDFVSEEAELAGIAAAKYISESVKREENRIIFHLSEGISYIVPHRINSDQNDVILYFRVANVFKNVIIIVRDNEKVLFKTRKQRVMPGEMERIRLTADMLRSIKGDTVYIELEHVN